MSRRPSSLLQLKQSDIFKPSPDITSDTESFLLEDDQYVREMKQRRGEIITKIDSNAGDRLRRKVGYEIERRLVKAAHARTLKKRNKKLKEETRHKNLTWHLPIQKRDIRRRRHRRHHRFCIKCVTSSFRALFSVILRPGAFCSHGLREQDLYHLQSNGDTTPEHRTPTPKMLLGADGKLQWPVFQFGGAPGTGMLISTTPDRFAPAPKADPDSYLKLPGRENFTLNTNGVEDQPKLGTTPASDEVVKSSSFLISDEDNRLLGWLQIPDPKSRKSKQYVPVVNPAPLGPFRKAPWHGNIHVLKF